MTAEAIVLDAVDLRRLYEALERLDDSMPDGEHVGLIIEGSECRLMQGSKDSSSTVATYRLASRDDVHDISADICRRAMSDADRAMFDDIKANLRAKGFVI